MKKLKLLSFLMIMVSSLMFIQCTSEPISGPQGLTGIDGVDGVNGVDGVDGVAGTATCVACHSESHREPIEASFLESKHFGNRTRSGSCAACHSEEGYFASLNGTFDEVNYPDASVLSKRTCTTCHSKHSTFDFENDGQDYALRSIGAVELTNMPGVTIDFDSTSNNCVQCHQPRDPEPTFEADGTFIVTDENKTQSPHYGVNATLLAGIQGILISGTEAYPGVDDNPHYNLASCTKCHMGEPNTNSQEGFGDEANGSHAFNPTLNACITCHSDATTFDYRGVQTEVNTLRDKLRDDMEAKGFTQLSSRGRPELIPGLVLPKAYVEIFWNYYSVYSDKSNGVHNPAYIKALLINTTQALEALPVITP
ncbi:MAG: hypothetical protein ACI8WT_005141 [Clostridium sp.]|jgi:hypothetical protein